MRVSVGIDIAKEVHWVTAIDDYGEIRLDHRLDNTPAAIEALIGELRALEGEVVIGLDMVGGIAGLAAAMLAAAGFRLVHVPGLAVNRARQGTTGGESKSDPRDARVIADQTRIRRDLRPIEAGTELDLEIRLLAKRRRDLVDDQTRRLNRLRDLLVSIFPGLERALDFTTKGALWLVSKYVTPAELREASRRKVVRHLQRAGGLPNVKTLADAALAAAEAQRIAISGERMSAVLIRELAVEALTTRERIATLERELETLLQHCPNAVLIRSLPGMGVVLTAEFIAEVGSVHRFSSADALAAAAGLAPVLRQSGKVRFLKRPTGGNKALKRVFYQSAFCSLQTADSRAFYDRKRKEGKRHHQALVALARRRINVLWAMLKDRQPFQAGFKHAA
jgi:transposase